MNKTILKITIALLVSCNVFEVVGQQSKKPNIVFILADDFGYTLLYQSNAEYE